LQGLGSRLARSQTAKFAPGRIVPAALTVVATPILARLITREDFGELALLQSAALLLGSALFGWAEVLIVRVFSGGAQISEAELSRLSRPAIAGIAGTFLVGAITTIALGSALPFLAALCAVSYAATLVCTALARARGDARLFVMSGVVGLGSRFVLGIPLVAVGGGVSAVLAMWTVGGILAVSVTARRLHLRWRRFRLSPVDKAHVAFALPVIAVSLGLLMLSLADRLILSMFLPASDVAPYALGYSLVDQAASLTFSILMASRFPAMVRTFEDRGEIAARRQLESAIGRFAAVTVVPLMLLGLYGSRIATWIGGPQYAGADFRFMPFVALGLFLNGLHQYCSVPSQQRMNTRAWAVAILSGVIVNVAGNFALIPILGTLGAGVATTSGYGAVVAWLLIANRTAISLPRRSLVLHACGVLAGILLAIATSTLPWLTSAFLAMSAYMVTARPLTQWRLNAA
jgi:O-antigen/teichoic acid export membrane protein